MLSPGVWYWTALVVVSLCPQGSYTVIVKVQSTVVTDQSRAKVILPCEYELENPNQGCNIRWDKGRDDVIVKDSLDQLFYGDKYTGRVKLGGGCSLVLLSPGLNDTGRYRVNIAALQDQNPWETAYVQLVVAEAAIREMAPDVSCVPQTSGPTPGRTSTEDPYMSPKWEDFIPVTIIALAALIAHTFFVRWDQRHGCKDICRRLYLGSPFVLLVIGVITAVIGMALRSRAVLLVSRITVTLGVVIQWICVFWIIRKKFEDSVRNPTPCSTDKTDCVSFLSDEDDVKMKKHSEHSSSNNLECSYSDGNIMNKRDDGDNGRGRCMKNV